MIKQILNSVIAKYRDLSVYHKSIICLSRNNWSPRHWQLTIFLLNLVQQLLLISACFVCWEGYLTRNPVPNSLIHWIDYGFNNHFNSMKNKWSKPYSTTSGKKSSIDIYKTQVQVAKKRVGEVDKINQDTIPLCGRVQNYMGRIDLQEGSDILHPLLE